MSDDAVRRALANLATTRGSERENGEIPPSTGRDSTFRETIERATVVIEDVEPAAQFVEDVGLDELERAVEHAERSVSACADDGRKTLAAFREFREAAEGAHFHSGHGTSLGGGDIGPSK